MQLNRIVTPKKLIVISVVAWYVSFVEPWWVRVPFPGRWVDYSGSSEGKVHHIHGWLDLIGLPDPLEWYDQSHRGIPWTAWGAFGSLFHLVYALVLGRVVWALRRGLSLPEPLAIHVSMLLAPLVLSYACSFAALVPRGFDYPVPWIGGWACFASAGALMLAWRSLWREATRRPKKPETDREEGYRTSGRINRPLLICTLVCLLVAVSFLPYLVVEDRYSLIFPLWFATGCLYGVMPVWAALFMWLFLTTGRDRRVLYLLVMGIVPLLPLLRIALLILSLSR